MGKTCKYYKQQKQVSYDGGITWQNLDEYQKGDLYEVDALDCGYLPTSRWIDIGYKCVGGNKWQIQVKEVSYDGGQTWTRTEETREFIVEYDSPDCGGGGGGDCECTSFNITSTKVNLPATTSDTEYIVGNYTGATNCESQIYFAGINAGSDFLGSWRFDNGNIYAKVRYENSSTSTRVAQYKIGQADCIGYVNAYQSHSPVPLDDKFQWNIQGHETHYDATIQASLTALQLEQFTSRKNGAELNAVLSSPASWIITNNSAYINNNELAPNITNTLYLQANTSSAARTGTLTLTQKGTSNTITLFITQGAYTPNCSITKFTIDSEVCKGDDVSYSFDVADTLCRTTQYFTFYDANGGSVSFNATPSNGKGSGTFSTSSCATGTGVVNVTVNNTPTNFNVRVKNCSQPTPNITVDFKFINASGAEMYWDYVDFYGTGGGAPLQIYFGQDALTPNAYHIVSKELSYTLENWQFSTIKLRDTFAMHRTLRCTFDNNKFVNGGLIKINILGVEE